MGCVGGPSEGTSLLPAQRREHTVPQLTLSVCMTAGTKGTSPALLPPSQQSRTAVRYKRQQRYASPACLICSYAQRSCAPSEPQTRSIPLCGKIETPAPTGMLPPMPLFLLCDQTCAHYSVCLLTKVNKARTHRLIVLLLHAAAGPAP